MAAVIQYDSYSPKNSDNKFSLLAKTLAVSDGYIPPQVELLAAIDINDIGSVNSFTRAAAAGYTSAGEEPFQREDGVDVLRSSHVVEGVQCVLLENDPTPCSLIAPSGVDIEVDGASWTVTFNAVVGSVDDYEWRIDNTGSWNSTGGLTTFGDTADPGVYSVQIRAVTPSGVAGAESDDEFEISGGALVNLSDNFNRANAGTLGANWTQIEGSTGINGNQAVTNTGGFVDDGVVHVTPLSSVNQYAKLTMSATNNRYVDVIFRYTDSGSPYYTVRFEDPENNVVWRRYASVGGAETNIQNAAYAQVLTAMTFGITITGTGDATTIRIWENPTGDIPDAADSWGGDTTPDITFTTNPGSPVDTGLLVGFSGVTNENIMIDNWFAGDIP